MNDDKYRIDKKETKVSGGYAYSFYEGKLAVGQVVFSVNSKNYVYRITTKSVSMPVSVILATIIARIIDIDLDFQEVPYKVVMNKTYTSNMLKIYINNNTTNNPVYVEPYVKTQTKK